MLPGHRGMTGQLLFTELVFWGRILIMFTLTEAYEALNGHDEFAVKVYDGKVSFDYIVIFPGSFDATDDEIQYRAYLLWERAGSPVADSAQFWFQAKKDIERFAHLRRNFRGVTFDVATGEMISLPLHKFFNVNQIPETQFDVIKHHDAVIYEKMDGTMIHFFLHNGKLEAATCRSTHHPLAHEALALAKKNRIDGMIIDTINNGWTPVFEYVAPHNQVVVQYAEPRLVYLISRERKSGKYHYNNSFPDKARRFEFKFGQVFNNLDCTEFEGYVCHLPDMVVKAKTPWYMERHRAVDALMRPAYKLYKIVFDGLMDDLIAIATEPYKPALRKVYEEAQRDLLNEKKRIEAIFAEALELSEKAPALTDEPNPLAELEQQINLLKDQGNRLDAIKLVRNFTGLGLSEAKSFVERGVWPHGFIRRDEQEFEARRLIRTKGSFADLVREKYPDDFGLIMALYQGRDPSDGIKDRLMEVYREKYPQKLYAKLEDNHEDG
jgi:ribosomal protein L7/L12